MGFLRRFSRQPHEQVHGDAATPTPPRTPDRADKLLPEVTVAPVTVPIGDGLAPMRAKIYALLPGDWMLFGPARRGNGEWAVGVWTLAPRQAGEISRIEATNANLVMAFWELADRIREARLTPGAPRSAPPDATEAPAGP